MASVIILLTLLGLFIDIMSCEYIIRYDDSLYVIIVC